MNKIITFAFTADKEAPQGHIGMWRTDKTIDVWNITAPYLDLAMVPELIRMSRMLEEHGG